MDAWVTMKHRGAPPLLYSVPTDLRDVCTLQAHTPACNTSEIQTSRVPVTTSVYRAALIYNYINADNEVYPMVLHTENIGLHYSRTLACLSLHACEPETTAVPSVTYTHRRLKYVKNRRSGKSNIL